ncbi:hypothetical protein ABL78_2933 [Leptomonas seymouri]|uniref:Uncharacterized protein n=1 Tax=Leptomonas seymouri TaxID=5684 RepID=A0A0N0P774_LEPSE|nr:hypothetical protein ABL78_2933 [Leptomonas seymouri]|eukprot:KPI87997.1 hypothetical protein ABL78_2933 [Leptomonas seymouri]
MTTFNDDERVVGGVYISAEEEGRLVDRLYTQSLAHKEATLAELQSRYYPVAAPSTISDEKLQRSVKRQVDEEMEQRRQRRAEMDAKAIATAMGYASHREAVAASEQKLSPEEVETSVQRLYDETLARKKANMMQSEKRYTFNPESIESKKMRKEDLQASVDRMSKPKKTVFTTAEINKIYGF